MRERDPSLNDLPKPASPRALDEKLLRLAREEAKTRRDDAAAEPRRTSDFAWRGGMATACMVLVGLLITRTPYEPVEHGFAPGPEQTAEQTTLQKGNPVMDYDTERNVENDVAQLQRQPAEPENRQTVEQAAKPVPAASPSASGGMRADVERARQEKRASAPWMKLREAAAPSTVSDGAVAVGAREMEETEVIVTARKIAGTPSEAEQRERLRECTALFQTDVHTSVHTGDVEAANQCLETLQTDCPDCDIPADIASALKRLEQEATP